MCCKKKAYNGGLIESDASGNNLCMLIWLQRTEAFGVSLAKLVKILIRSFISEVVDNYIMFINKP